MSIRSVLFCPRRVFSFRGLKVRSLDLPTRYNTSFWNVQSLLGFLFTIIATLAQAQDATSPTVEGDRLVAEYFRLETQRLAQVTEQLLNSIQSVEEWEVRRRELRQQLFEMLGLDPLPPKSDLQPVITGQIEHDQFIVEKLQFQSLPGLYVTGNLYLPKQVSGPLPTVLYVCGHSQNKKDGVSYGNKVGYQHHGAWYARNGYACLTIDTLQLGEIEGVHHGTYRDGMWWWLSRGYTPAGVEAWNCIRALDYLETRQEIDKTRLGVCGRSGGGAYSWWIAALDDRIQVAVPVAGITTLKNHVVDGCIEGHCDCMFQVNTYGWDYALVAALVAPRPLLIANTDKDTIFPLDGVVDIHRQVRRIYELYGKPQNLGLNITEGPHKDTQELQVHEFVWFNRFLKKDETPIDKIATKYFEPEQLKVFETLPADQRNTRIQEEFIPIASAPPANTSPTEQEAIRLKLITQLREKTFRAWPTLTPESLDVRQVSSSSQRDILWSEYSFLSQEPYRLSLIMASPQELVDRSQVKQVNMHLLDQTEWARIQPLIDLARSEAQFKLTAQQGHQFTGFLAQCRAEDTVNLFFAPRGVGLTEWNRDERERTHIRRRFALLGQTDGSARVFDVVRAISTVRSFPEFQGKQLTLYGSRHAATWGLYASLYMEPGPGMLSLSELPATDREGPDFLNISRYLDIEHSPAILVGPTGIALHKSLTTPPK